MTKDKRLPVLEAPLALGQIPSRYQETPDPLMFHDRPQLDFYLVLIPGHQSASDGLQSGVPRISHWLLSIC